MDLSVLNNQSIIELRQHGDSHCNITCIYVQTTFMSVKTWISELRQHGDSQCLLVVIGNKCDLTTERQVEKAGWYYFEVYTVYL